uniref:S-formylglutathione hydrolase n=2 Tax=Ciona intestinalis TaxID=7719 RepID=F7B6S8_CIOIN
PALYYLSGLTCTEQNVVTKGGTQGPAAKQGLVIITPDTSPRGCNIEGEDDGYDFGSGAGFYVNATEEKWKTNYRMYAYVTKELPQVISANFG